MRRIIDQQYLFELLSGVTSGCFSLFLGAGASASSGVKTASEIVRELVPKFEMMYRSAIEKEKWFGKPNEYSSILEAVFPARALRRDYIESCLEEAVPSFGYICLAHLVGKNLFPAVFSTNFDDLLNEACMHFTEFPRPVVCAHDSSINTVRITSSRPKIVKLHGDFLFDDLKNTPEETSRLESNIAEKFRQFALEYGLIVIGYGGNDNSVMSSLESLLRADENFPHGVFWCTRSGDQVGERVTSLACHPRVSIVEIEGFDEFFSGLCKYLGYTPRLFEDPLSLMHQRLIHVLSNLKYSRKPAQSEIGQYVSDLVKRVPGLKVPATTVPLLLAKGELESANAILRRLHECDIDLKHVAITVKYLNTQFDDLLFSQLWCEGVYKDRLKIEIRRILLGKLIVSALMHGNAKPTEMSMADFLKLLMPSDIKSVEVALRMCQVYACVIKAQPPSNLLDFFRIGSEQFSGRIRAFLEAVARWDPAAVRTVEDLGVIDIDWTKLVVDVGSEEF